MVARAIADLEGVFKQLISLKFLIASAHWACADVLDHHSWAHISLTATSTAPPTSAATYNTEKLERYFRFSMNF